MSFMGTGGEDWVELDVDLFDRQRQRDLHLWFDLHRARLEDWLGSDYHIEVDDTGNDVLVVDGKARYRLSFGNDDRMVFTPIFSDEGLL